MIKIGDKVKLLVNIKHEGLPTTILLKAGEVATVSRVTEQLIGLTNLNSAFGVRIVDVELVTTGSTFANVIPVDFRAKKRFSY